MSLACINGPSFARRSTSLAAASILIVAAVLKSTTFLETGKRSGMPQGVLALLCGYELMLGTTLLVAGNIRKYLTLSSATFAAFGCIAAVEFINRHSTCYCFGTVDVNPIYICVVDIIFAAALYFARRKISKNQRGLERRDAVIIWALGAAITICVLVGKKAETIPVQEGAGFKYLESGTLLLQPDLWIGKECPVIRYIDVENQIQRGRWIIIFHFHNCTKCLEQLPHFKDLSYGLQQNGSDIHMALIEIPPYKMTGEAAGNKGSYLAGHLSNKYLWLIRTPSVMCIEQGKVVDRHSWTFAPEFAKKFENIFSDGVDMAHKGERR